MLFNWNYYFSRNTRASQNPDPTNITLKNEIYFICKLQCDVYKVLNVRIFLFLSNFTVEDEALKDWGHVSNPAFLYEAMKP